jgi:protein-tyrosine phosphatase
VTTTVLAVCLGNICRSPTAEAALREAAAEAGLDLHVRSAGTGDWHVGSPPDRRMRSAAAEVGLTIDGAHRGAGRRPRMLDEADLVLAMDRSNLRDLERLAATAEVTTPIRLFREFDPEPGDGEVPDPYYGGPDGFVEVVDIVRRTAREVVRHLADRRPGAPAVGRAALGRDGAPATPRTPPRRTDGAAGRVGRTVAAPRLPATSLRAPGGSIGRVWEVTSAGVGRPPRGRPTGGRQARSDRRHPRGRGPRCAARRRRADPAGGGRRRAGVLVLDHVGGPATCTPWPRARDGPPADRPAFGWHRDNVIGPLPQANPWTDHWPTFFIEQRITPTSTTFPLELSRRLQAACAGPLPDLLDHDAVPSLVHGDLWGGQHRR